MSVANLYLPRKFRERRAKELVKYISTFVVFAPNDVVVDLGAGWGEIAAEIVRRFGCRVGCFDLYTFAISKIRESAVWGKMSWRISDVCKEGVVGKNIADKALMLYFLQVLDTEGKKAALRAAIIALKEDGEIIVVDETPRKFWSQYDKAIHYGLNLFEKCKGFNLLTNQEYKNLFAENGLQVKAQCQWGNRVIYVLSKIE